ncbi:MAG: glycoside hydrolase [Bacteroidota bacterium]|nr:glycoside hydrolase [Bacteroidota bacterium]
MKKITFALLSLLFSTSLFAVDNILLDFELGTVPSTVSSWLNYSNAGTSASTWSIANPQTDAVNSTLNCYKITKQSGDPYWTGLEVNLVSPIIITSTNQYLHVLVYKNTTSRIALTYTPAGGTQSPDAWLSNSTTGAWIDYVLNIPTGTSLKTFAIKIADDPGNYYFDQIMLSDNPASISRTPVTIDPAIQSQIIEGWGASLCWWANIMGGFSDSKIKTICDWITDPVNGLNMNIFRFNIGGGDDPTHNHMRTDGGAMPGYKASLAAPYDWTQDANQRKILQQLIASRVAKTGVNDIQLVGFSNSPPYWMTRSGCSAGSVEGNVTNLRSDMFDEFADYLTEVAKYYHDNLGISFNYLEPFNEPDGAWWKAYGNQEGCYFSDNDQMVMIRALYTKLSAKNMLSYCQITANDANQIDNGYNSVMAYKNAGDILAKMALISVHTYGGSKRAELALFAKGNGKKLWQSESGPIGISGTNEHNIMVMSDRIITDMRDLKCSAWNDWQIGGDGGATNNPWALIVSTYSNNLNPISKGIAFYIRAQYSRYLKAGYTLINNSADNVLTAISPDATELVIVISNQATYTQKYSFDLSKFSNLGKVQQIRTRVQESLGIKNSVTLFNITGNSFTYDALSESVTTFVVPINQAPAAVNEVEKNLGDMYYSNGVIHTNFTNDQPINISIYNTIGQLIKNYGKVSFCGIQPVYLKSGFYIVSTKIGNKTISRKIEVY